MYLVPEDVQQEYFMDHDMEDYTNYWADKYYDEGVEKYLREQYGDEWEDHLDEIEEASYGEDYDDEDDDEEYDFYDDEDDYYDEEDDDDDLPPLPWN